MVPPLLMYTTKLLLGSKAETVLNSCVISKQKVLYPNLLSFFYLIYMSWELYLNHAMLYPKPCYNEQCYEEVCVYTYGETIVNKSITDIPYKLSVTPLVNNVSLCL